MTREALDESLSVWDLNDPQRNDAMLETIIAAARKQLALMAEKCETCGGRGVVDGNFGGAVCPTCHGSGYLYPAETIRRINAALDRQPREKAVAVLDALGETE